MDELKCMNWQHKANLPDDAVGQDRGLAKYSERHACRSVNLPRLSCATNRPLTPRLRTASLRVSASLLRTFLAVGFGKTRGGFEQDYKDQRVLQPSPKQRKASGWYFAALTITCNALFGK